MWLLTKNVNLIYFLGFKNDLKEFFSYCLNSILCFEEVALKSKSVKLFAGIN